MERKKLVVNQKKANKYVFIIVLFLLISLAVELLVFNYRHWETRHNHEIAIEQMMIGSAFQNNRNGTYTIGEGSLDIEITGIDQLLTSAWIDIKVLNRNEGEIAPVILWQAVTDEAHQLYYGLPERELWVQEKRSSYMTYHLYGNCHSLRLTPNLSQGQVVSFEIRLNPKIPLFVSGGRILAVFLVLLAVYWFRPKSALYSVKISRMSYHNKHLLFVGLFLINAIVFYMLTSINPLFQWERGDHQKQYQELAEAFSEGHFWLLEEPTQALQDMKNPYDYNLRAQVMSDSGEWFKWDHVYYNGKYYVYFGVVPVVLFYYPVYTITGEHLSNHTMIFIASLLFLLGLLGTLYEIGRKWFSNMSVGVWVLSTELLLGGSGIVYMTKRPDLYTVPILLGHAFGLLGLWCILLAIKGEKLSISYVVAGSFLTALVAGCRPQLFLFILFTLILLKSFLLSKENFGGEEWKRLMIAYAIPMLVVAGLLMYYNYSRFGSPFDFGANYNLTFNDMRRRGWIWDRIPLGIIAYLFQPLRLSMKFPFTEAIFFDTQYMGITIQEATFGGLLMVCPFAGFSFLSVVFGKQLKKIKTVPWQIAVTALVAAVIIIIADTEMSGILMRYFGDFRLFFMLSSILSVWMITSCFDVQTDVIGRMIIWMLLFCAGVEIIYQGMIFFLDTGETLREARPELYAHYKYMISFWL